MPETVETLANRLDRLEATMQQMSDRLSRFTDEPTPQQQEPENFKTSAELLAYYRKDKAVHAKIFCELLEKMGISGKPTVPLKELRESMVRGGIRPKDNEFSRAIIEEREK
ncbi:hypothetical protein IH992_10945 [Candidatus Poribacteria bacterium]|nr:hypothetical protein [Candidatus Poribacteria bacterium]